MKFFNSVFSTAVVAFSFASSVFAVYSISAPANGTIFEAGAAIKLDYTSESASATYQLVCGNITFGPLVTANGPGVAYLPVPIDYTGQCVISLILSASVKATATVNVVPFVEITSPAAGAILSNNMADATMKNQFNVLVQATGFPILVQSNQSYITGSIEIPQVSYKSDSFQFYYDNNYGAFTTYNGTNDYLAVATAGYAGPVTINVIIGGIKRSTQFFMVQNDATYPVLPL